MKRPVLEEFDITAEEYERYKWGHKPSARWGFVIILTGLVLGLSIGFAIDNWRYVAWLFPVSFLFGLSWTDLRKEFLLRRNPIYHKVDKYSLAVGQYQIECRRKDEQHWGNPGT